MFAPFLVGFLVVASGFAGAVLGLSWHLHAGVLDPEGAYGSAPRARTGAPGAGEPMSICVATRRRARSRRISDERSS